MYPYTVSKTNNKNFKKQSYLKRIFVVHVHIYSFQFFLEIADAKLAFRFTLSSETMCIFDVKPFPNYSTRMF